ncbi:MAG: PilN domain-containing protein, partial [Candidatus Aminicenantes bacterium]|nr:PilN domain-containing protein [Candidatus Aminicenantes bacterium]
MIRVNLLKVEKKEIEAKAAVPLEPEVKAKKKTPAGNLVIFFIILLLAALAYVQQKTLDTERGLLNSIRKEKQQLEPVLAKLDQVEQQKTFLQRKIGLINQLKARQSGTVRIMETLSAGIPEWVWLTEATLAKQNLQIKGRALSNILISDYMRNLDKSGIFETVSLLNSAQKTQGGNAFLEFTLSADIAPPPGLMPAAAPGAPPPNRPVKGQAFAAEVDPRAKPGALTRDVNTRLSTAETDPQTKPGAPAAAP